MVLARRYINLRVRVRLACLLNSDVQAPWTTAAVMKTSPSSEQVLGSRLSYTHCGAIFYALESYYNTAAAVGAADL